MIIALLTILKIQIIIKNKFIVMELDKKDKTYIVYMAIINIKIALNIYLS